MDDYLETCPGCDGWEFQFSNEREEDGKIYFTVVCRECTLEWEDYKENDG